MAFTAMKLKPESGANRIKNADDAYSFMMHMRLSYQNKPHLQVARQALNHAGASDASEIQAWRTFRAAAAAKGWLAESGAPRGLISPSPSIPALLARKAIRPVP